ncbi:MAG TPA: class I SAM-dependent methyltransferase [Candidatus Dormibacteraeota bacterium]|nr:class I SAM-dependent methyltransferase [Candidatus Dormibacteraeota bacterium]
MCRECGLIRDGVGFEFEDLTAHYGKSYQLNTTDSGEEHVFFSPAGPVPRSQVIHDWIVQIKPDISGSVLEVGCGQGSVLERLTASFPQAQFSGIDMNEQAAGRARRKGLDVKVGSSTDIVDRYDLIIAFGVLEHVPSPTNFLTDLRERLSPRGELVVGQPMQNVPSYDLFFVDHLHHFTTNHVRLLGQNVGLEQTGLLEGCALVSNFSLHRFRKAALEKPAIHFENPPSIQSIRKYLDAFAKINSFVSQSRRIAVFGTGEVFTLLYAYTDLATTEIACGLDDNRDRRENHAWPFPVIRPEEAHSLSVSDVLLSVNPRYNEMVVERLRALGLKPTVILDNDLS